MRLAEKLIDAVLDNEFYVFYVDASKKDTAVKEFKSFIDAKRWINDQSDPESYKILTHSDWVKWRAS